MKFATFPPKENRDASGRNLFRKAWISRSCLFVMAVLFYMNYPLQAEPRIVRVGLFSAPPLVQIENNLPSGLFIDLIHYFSIELGWTVQYIKAPWNELLIMLEKGEIDLLPAISYTIERTAIYDYSQHPVFIDSGVLFTNSQFTIHSIFDLQNKRIAGVKGSIFTTRFIEYISSFGIECEVKYVVDNETVMKDISQGNVEAGICIYSLGIELAKKYQVVITPISFSPLALEYAVPKNKNQDLLLGINRLMSIMVIDQNSVYTKSFQKWTFPPQSYKFPLWLKIGIFALLLLGLFFIIWTILLKRMVLLKTNSLKIEIEERKQAEENIKQNLVEKETLLRELHHRTKNTLQVIRGMIVLQADSYPENKQVNDLVKQTEMRIQTISLVHQMLYKSNDLSKISIKTFIHDLTSLIMQGFLHAKDNIILDLDILEHNVLLDTAIPLGLIINELMTNSLKYAFQEKKHGKIRIALQKAELNTFTLQYSDDGIGIPDEFDFRKSKSFGLNLINDIIEQQLQGKITFSNSNGFSCIAEFADNLYEVRV